MITCPCICHQPPKSIITCSGCCYKTPTQSHDPIEGIDELIRDITRVGFAAKSEVRERLKKMIDEAYALGQHAGLSGNIKNLDSVTVTSEIPQSIYNAIFEKGREAGVREAIGALPKEEEIEDADYYSGWNQAMRETKSSLTNLLSLHE